MGLCPTPRASRARRARYLVPRYPAILLAVLLTALACSPAGGPAGKDGDTPRGAAAEKTLVIGIQQEPSDFYGFAGSTGFGGVSNVPPIALDTLVVTNADGEYQPQLAAAPPSLADGTWRVNADGTMDTTWKLRPNLKWHDGTPFTAEDLVFTARVRTDSDTAIPGNGRLDLIQSTSAPDPQTFVIHWSAAYALADHADDLQPMAKHLLAETFETQKANFSRSPLLASQFVGEGPYRLTDWQAGSQMTFVRFDDYYQGRPPLDRVIVKFLIDPGAMVANILSGNVDMLLPKGVGLDAALDVEKRWAGTGNEVHYDVGDASRQIEIQFRPDVARPTDGLTRLAVRQAFYQSIDRKLLSDLFAGGVGPPADSWLSPRSKLRAGLEASIPRFAYDASQAGRLLAGAGWSRGADGVLVNSQTGERFETELRVSVPEEQKLMSVVADQWRQLGAQVTETVVPPARANDREYGSTYTGGLFSAGPMSAMVFGGRTHSKDLRSAANRWTGRNRAGYVNPELDTLLDRVAIAIDPAEFQRLLGDVLQIQIGQLVVMPLFWDANPVLQLKGVKSHPGAGQTTTWNFFEFDKI